MNTKLIVTKMKADDASVIRVSTKTPTWGSIMVQSTSVRMNNGVINIDKVNGFLRAPLATLNLLGIKEGMDFNEISPSKIVIIDSYTPNPTYDHKPRVRNIVVNGVKTGTEPILSVDGRAIFRESKVVDLNSEEVDVIIRVKAKAAVAVASEATVESQDFA